MAILTYKLTVNTDTQEVSITKLDENKKIVHAEKQLKQRDGSSKPKLFLYEQKYVFNDAAIEFMNLKAGDRLIIAYDINGKPIIGKQEAFGSGMGNKLSTTNSVVLRGQAREQLANFGDVFDIECKGDNLYSLVSESTEGQSLVDDNLQIPSNNGFVTNSDLTLDIDTLLDQALMPDESNYTVSGLDFKF